MQNRNRSLIAASVLAVFGLAACGDDVSVTPPAENPIRITAINVAPQAATVGVGGTQAFSASVVTNGGTGTIDLAVSWSSGNTAVATVNATSGVVTGVTIGSTTITATSVADNTVRGSGTINVVAAPNNLTAFNVTPNDVTLGTGATITLVPNVTTVGNPTVTYTYSSSNTSVATVTNAGVVTAVAAGTAVITATATTNTNSLSATATIRVINGSVSIASVTQGGLPVNLLSVIGQFEVTLNVASGAQQLDSVEVRLDGIPGASQVFTVNGAPTAPITLSINSAAYRINADSTATVRFKSDSACTAACPVADSSTTVQALLYPRGTGAPTASNTVVIHLKNSDTFHARWTNPANSAVGAAGGNGTLWFGGPGTSVTLNVIPVFYSGKSAASVTFNFTDAHGNGPPIGPLPAEVACGANAVDTASPFVATFGCAGVSADSMTAEVLAWNYTDNTAGANAPVRNTLVPTPAGSSQPFANVPLAPIQIDMVSPCGVALVLPATPNNWINGAFNWTASTTTNRGEDFEGETATLCGAPAVGVGRAAASTDIYTVAFADSTPVTFSPFTPNPNSIAEHPTNFTEQAYTANLAVADLLGNVRTVGLTGTNQPAGCNGTTVLCEFGVDRSAPEVGYTGAGAVSPVAAVSPNVVAANEDSILNDLVANTQGLTSATPALFGVRLRDSRSGFDTLNNNFLFRRITRLAPSGTTCAEGGTACAFVNPPALPPVGNDDQTYRRDSLPVFGLTALLTPTTPGYYTYETFVRDRAGNQSPTVTKRAAIDITAPQITGLNPNFTVLVGASTVSWTPIGSDDLEDTHVSLYLNYPNMTGGMLRYPGHSVADRVSILDPGFTVDAPWNTTLATPVGPNQPFGAAGFAIPHGWLNGIDVVSAVDSTPPVAVSATYGPTAAAAQFYDIKRLEATLGGATPDSSGLFTAPILPAQLTPGVPFSAIGIGKWFIFSADTTSATANIQARAKTSTSITNVPFPQVAFFRQTTDGVWQYLGRVVANAPTNPTIFDQGSDRFWTYTFTAFAPALASGDVIRAVGMSAAGNGLSTLTFTVP
jgi:hypothetical protein